MMKQKLTLGSLLLVILILLVGVGLVGAATSPEIEWYVLGGGGGRDSAGNYTLYATIGQPLAGLNSADGVDLCSGFWCKLLEAIHIFLPTVFR